MEALLLWQTSLKQLFHACLVHLTVFGSFWYNFVVPLETGVSTIHEAVTITTTGTKTRLLRISGWKCPSKQIRFFFQETQAVHMNMTQGSYLEFTVPMVVEENGYEMKINGQLFHLDATTSLAFRSLLDCETFEVRYMDYSSPVM